MDNSKKCRYCNKFYPLDAFGVALTTPIKIYRRNKCRDCYRLTKAALAQKHLSFINRIKEETGCRMCGIKDSRILDFHHTNGKEKLFAVGTFRRAVGFERIKNEILKCEILCANCHRISHSELREKLKNGV